MVQNSKCTKGYAMLSPLPPLSPTSRFPLQRQPVLPRSPGCAYVSKYVFTFSSLQKHQWEMLYTHFCTLPFSLEDYSLLVYRYSYIYSCIVLYCIRICLINPLRKEDLVISNYRSCLHICPQSRPVEGSLGGTEAPPQEAQAHLHDHM